MMAVGEGVGFLASTLVLLTFLMKDMRRLRAMALCSNVAFIIYGGIHELMPVVALHLLLLPLNFVRLMEVRGSAGRVSS
ncbi:MAG: hypothetical protein ACM31O_18545 [Bacteroidota bacterium]|jgi:hypothetical protein